MTGATTRLLTGLLVAATLAACAVGPDYRRPHIDAPDHFAATVPAVSGVSGVSGASGASGASTRSTATDVDPTRWWHVLGDLELDSLVARAVEANPDVLVALDRLQAARVHEMGLIGGALPRGEASAAAGRGTGSDLTRTQAPAGLRTADSTAGLRHIDTIGGFDALWQLDVFGRYRRELEAMDADREASIAARDAVLVAVIANVARAYVDLRGLQVRAGVLAQALEVARASLRIVRIRFDRGITNELDVTLARRELSALEAQRAPIEAGVSAAGYTIATLVGRFPEDLVAELQPEGLMPVVPAVPAPLAPGLPVEVVRRRPDIRQAERELAAAHAGIGVATGALFPRVGVSGATGFQRQGLGSTPISGRHIWTAGAGVIWPLLDFGQLDAAVEVAGYETRARLVEYRRKIQDAVKEVDIAWAQLGAQQASLESLGDALLASQRAVTLATERYQRGLTDYLNVVDAQRAQFTLEAQYAQGQVAVAEQFVALYRAMGGGWEQYQQLPPVHRPQPAVLAIFERTLGAHDPLRPLAASPSQPATP